MVDAQNFSPMRRRLVVTSALLELLEPHDPEVRRTVLRALLVLVDDTSSAGNAVMHGLGMGGPPSPPTPEGPIPTPARVDITVRALELVEELEPRSCVAALSAALLLIPPRFYGLIDPDGGPTLRQIQ